MRPLDLTISAFGSYKGTVEIDFSLFEETGVFLICGNTGAGKSTIFDAISFALFGESSGGQREAQMLRSEYADPTTKTSVKLRFEYAGKEYTVERSLPYSRLADKRKKDKDGGFVDYYVEQSATANLSSPGEPPISSVKEVNKKIESILGINHDQFTKIAMIPQGEFQKLLQSDNDDKQLILRKVFGTERFHNLEESIAKEVSEVEAERKVKQNAIQNLLEGIKGNENSQAYSTFLQAMDDYIDPDVQLEKMIELAEDLIKEDKSSLEETETSIKVCKDNETQLTALKQKIETNNIEKERRNKILDEQKQLKKNLSDLLKEKEKNPERKKEADKKKGELALLDDQIPLYSQYDKDKEQLDSDRRDLENSKKLLQEARDNRNTLIDEKGKLEKELKTLEGCELEKEDIKHQGETLKNTIQSLEKLKERIEEVESDERELENAKRDLELLLNKKSEAGSRHDSSHNLFLRAQAGYMAEGLQDGVPCPVCGSLHHPSKAVLPPGAPTEQQVNNLKEAYERVSDEAEKKSNQCAGMSSALKGKTDEIKRIVEEMGDALHHKDYKDLKADNCSALKLIIKESENKRYELRTLYNEAENKCSRLKKLTDEIIPEKDKRIAELTTIIESDTSGEKEARVQAKEKILNEQRSKLSFGSEKEALKEKEKLEKDIKELENTIKETEDTANDCNEKIISNESVLKDLERRIDESLSSDLVKVRNDIEENKKALGENERKKTEAKARLMVNNPALKQLKDERKSYSELCRELEWKKNLSDTLRGTLSGKAKIELETFVLMSYFDRILYKASLRLYDMSSGQYELVRSEGAGSLKAKTGLGIAVKDHYSGKTRDIKSLSGGETFLASLALALGLSDETQSSSGGVKIDTMFVDEGFGSLSPDVLELALKTLERLAQKGTLIGLISHVESMRNRYRKIMVEKSADEGSTISIE